MSKSIKLKNDNYWDSSSVVHNEEPLNNILNKDIKLLQLSQKITISGNKNYYFIMETATYRNSIDLTQYSWYPQNAIAVLTSEGYYISNGNYRCIALPNIDKPITNMEIFAPIAGDYNVRILILYKE
jgi:hypothetical protein